MDRGDEALKAIREAMIANEHVSNSRDVSKLIATATPCFSMNLRKHCRVITRRDEEVLRGRNDREGHCFYRLLKGDVSLHKEIMGERVTLQRVAPGDWLLEPQPCKDSADTFAIVERESMLIEVPVSVFNNSLECEPGFAQAWCNELSLQMARMQRKIERICLRHTSQRIIHYLATESPGNCGEVILPFPKYVWAAHMGMTPETLSRALGELIKAERVKSLGGNRYRLMHVG